MNKLFSTSMNFDLKIVIAGLVVFLTISCVSVKPIYNADEQTKAERAVAEVHKLYDNQNFEGIYNLFDEEAQQSTPKDTILIGIKQTFEKWGKIQSSKLSQVKVFPSNPIQVRMIYNVKFEKGDAQEWYVWIIRGDEARLVQVQNFPGFDKGESKQ